MLCERHFFEWSTEINRGGVQVQGQTVVFYHLYRILKINKLFEYMEVAIERIHDEEVYLMNELK